MEDERELLSAGEIARRLNRTRRGVVGAIRRLKLQPAAVIDGERKVYDPAAVTTIGENMRAKKGGRA